MTRHFELSLQIIFIIFRQWTSLSTIYSSNIPPHTLGSLSKFILPLYPIVYWLTSEMSLLWPACFQRGSIFVQFLRGEWLKVKKKKGGKKERERSWVYNNNNNNEVNVFWAPRVTAKVPSSNTLNKIVFIASPTSVYRVQWRHCRFSNVKTIKQNRNLCRDGGKITGRNRNQRCAIVVYHVWCIPNSIYSSAPRLFLTETDKVEERKFWWSLLPDKWCQNSMRFACRPFWTALV